MAQLKEQVDTKDIAMEEEEEGEAKDINKAVEQIITEDIGIQQAIIEELMEIAIRKMTLSEPFRDLEDFISIVISNTNEYVVAWHNDDEKKKTEKAEQVGFILAHLMQCVFNAKNIKHWKPRKMKYVKKKVVGVYGTEEAEANDNEYEDDEDMDSNGAVY